MGFRHCITKKQKKTTYFFKSLWILRKSELYQLAYFNVSQQQNIAIKKMHWLIHTTNENKNLFIYNYKSCD